MPAWYFIQGAQGRWASLGLWSSRDTVSGGSAKSGFNNSPSLPEVSLVARSDYNLRDVLICACDIGGTDRDVERMNRLLRRSRIRSILQLDSFPDECLREVASLSPLTKMGR